MCKGKECPNIDKCKCNNNVDKQNINYDDYVMTTSPHHIRNQKVDVESTTFTDEDENLFLINLGELGLPDSEEEI
ncbi:hypothetical protein VPIG_00016 [Vibrio phage PWH3a-P1]|uniref:hypothetical protein n=1 Tax=Vibrio phage PWH3a-P1 TaxID=754058 RepID=UPI0002C14AC0|nr:hypothetical protein VPIG_00016 [Vibrio phage PWH3a-P1]AGH31874.1 hypothetical protein VPIG_00016 [Vibrio phage PWH3a-P1]